MKELKSKPVWIVKVTGYQANTFRLKSDAIAYAVRVGGVVTGRENRITDKY
jgi:hypothetical protein